MIMPSVTASQVDSRAQLGHKSYIQTQFGQWFGISLFEKIEWSPLVNSDNSSECQ